jgi:hypothetical protein
VGIKSNEAVFFVKSNAMIFPHSTNIFDFFILAISLLEVVGAVLFVVLGILVKRKYVGFLLHQLKSLFEQL